MGHILQYAVLTKPLSNAYGGLEMILAKKWNEGEIAHEIKIGEWSSAAYNSASSKDFKMLSWTDVEMVPIVVVYTTQYQFGPVKYTG